MAVDITGLKAALYDMCKDDVGQMYRQNDLLELGVIPGNDPSTLLKVTQALVDEKLFKMVHDGANIAWMSRSQEDAKKYYSLSDEQGMVYSLIEDAGQEGIWTKTIKMKTNLHDSLIRSAIKILETRHLITDMKSVEHPTRKMYIKSDLRPSERATGGPWYTDGELDEEFIEMISQVLYGYIKSKSFYQSKGATRKQKSTKDKKVKIEVDEEAQRKARGDNLLPLPPGYQGYPTLKELTLFVENAKITSSTLTAEDIQVLLNVLCFDNKIEQLISGPEGVSYKAIRRSPLEIEEGPRNGLTEAPCGRCPVFDLCEEGGPVGPSNCEYFKQWLNI